MTKKKEVPKKEDGGTVVSGCTFIGSEIVWGGEAIEAVVMVAEGLRNLTRIFEGQNIEIGPLLSLGSSEDE